jgi:autotransporter-associated beta strand protein
MFGAKYPISYKCIAVALVLVRSLYGATDPIPSTWNGVTGNWSNPNNWSPIGTVPNNTGSLSYAAIINGGIATTDVPVNLANLMIGGGQLKLSQAMHTTDMTISAGTVVSSGKLQVDGDLVLRGGQINNTAGNPDGFVVGGRVIKRGYGQAILAPFGTNGNYEIVVEEGKFLGSNGAYGSNSQATTIANPEFARIECSSTAAVSDDVYLNDAHGFNGTGALVSNTTNGSLTGNLYLGDVGGTIGLISGGGTNGILTLYGKVFGGAIDLVGSGTVMVEGTGHTYSGPTEIGLTGDGTKLQLRRAGQFLSTSGFEVGGNATLLLDNSLQNNTDRIPDHAPVLLRGGTLELSGAQSGSELSSENIGPLQLEQGTSTVRLRDLVSFASFDRLEHNGASTIDFVIAGVQSARQFFFDEQPIVTDGYIGGWATYRGDDFATYDSSLGIVGLGNRVTRPNQIDTAGPDDHVRTSQTVNPLTADHTITSLVIGGGDVNLGGRSLTIQGGGLINSSGGPQILNGQLTAGDGLGPANLYVRCLGTGLGVNAAIVDRGVGAPLSVVKTGSTNLTLSGQNTYSGATIIQEGSVLFTAEQALPTASDLTVDDGIANLQYQPTAVKKLGQVSIKQRGLIIAAKIAGTQRSAITIDANEVVLESGTSAVSYSGSGMIRKTTNGAAELDYDSPDFKGEVVVEQGTLIAGSHSVVRSPLALGSGVTTINSGGTLVHSAVTSVGSFMELDAALDLAGGSVGIGSSISTTQWDFNGPWVVSVPSRLLLFDPLAQSEISLPTVNLRQSVALSAAAGLTILGQGTVNVLSGLIVSGDTSLDASESSIKLSSISPTCSDAILHLRGAGSFEIPRNLSLIAGASLKVEIAADSTAHPAAGNPFNLNDGVTLIVNGHLNNTQPLIVNKGNIQGTGVIGDVMNNDGSLSPGNSIGVLTVGAYNQGSNGVANFELFGGPDNLSDQLRARTASLSGTLNVFLAPNAQVEYGETFDLLIANQVSVSNLQLHIDGLTGRLDVVTVLGGADAGRRALQLTIIPEPSSLGLSLMAVLLVWRPWVRRRLDPRYVS